MRVIGTCSVGNVSSLQEENSAFYESNLSSMFKVEEDDPETNLPKPKAHAKAVPKPAAKPQAKGKAKASAGTSREALLARLKELGETGADSEDDSKSEKDD